jgi:threonine aldolase
MKIIDLRSDTLTKPSDAMWEYMRLASVGDASYEEDESTSELENYCADLFQKPAALFMASGTMSNQVALRCHTLPGDEVITDSSYHINYFEGWNTADLAKVHLNSCNTDNGILTVADILFSLENRARSQVTNYPTLICLENTINAFGGKIFPLNEMKAIYEFSRQANLKTHLDGARLLNACIATDISPATYAGYCDSLCVCFSKGLGAPFGSILMGESDFIQKAKKYRKWYGGGLHQSGIMAAAALFSIKNNVERLRKDHENAKIFAENIESNNCFRINLKEVQTNIVKMELIRKEINIEEFLLRVKKEGVNLYRWDNKTIRAVFHLNVNDNDALRAAEIINKCIKLYELEKH